MMVVRDVEIAVKAGRVSAADSETPDTGHYAQTPESEDSPEIGHHSVL